MTSFARTWPWERLNAATCFCSVSRSASGRSRLVVTWNQTVMYVVPSILPSHVVSEAWRCVPLPPPAHPTIPASKAAINDILANTSDERVTEMLLLPAAQR
jgi:hypothetical protein